MDMRLAPIYRRGTLQVVPYVTLIRIQTAEGKVLDTYHVNEIDEAIRTCDEMAESLPDEVAA